jgi:hypothetical protein
MQADRLNPSRNRSAAPALARRTAVAAAPGVGSAEEGRASGLCSSLCRCGRPTAPRHSPISAGKDETMVACAKRNFAPHKIDNQRAALRSLMSSVQRLDNISSSA